MCGHQRIAERLAKPDEMFFRAKEPVMPRTRTSGRPDAFLLSAAAFVTVLALRPDGAFLRAQSQPSLPARFDSYLKAHVKLTADEYKLLVSGQPVTQLLETDPEKEVAIFGAV